MRSACVEGAIPQTPGAEQSGARLVVWPKTSDGDWLIGATLESPCRHDVRAIARFRAGSAVPPSSSAQGATRVRHRPRPATCPGRTGWAVPPRSASAPMQMRGRPMVTITTRARAGLAVLVRHPWVVLALWSACWSLIHVAGRGWSWHFIAEGSTALFSSSGLDLYAQHPELQMGPLNFVLGAPFVLLLRGRPGEAAGLAFMLALGLLVVRELRARTGQRTVRSDQLWLGSSLLIMLVWTELAVHWGHLDDAMALLCTVVALRMVRSGHVLA